MSHAWRGIPRVPVLGLHGHQEGPARPSGRLHAIDSARGAAMVLVCLSHFAAVYLAPAGGESASAWLGFLGHVASPMFFVISGAMVGFLGASRPDTFGLIRAKLARRAAFFLTVGHLLILGAVVHSLVDLAHLTRMLFVTDTIAIALLISPRLLTIRPAYRVAGAVATYTIAATLVYAWKPDGLAGVIVKDTLVGSDGVGFWRYNVPLLPWLAVHAAGTVVGGRLVALQSGARRASLERYLASLGCLLIAAAAVVRGASWFLTSNVFPARGEAARIATHIASPWNRLPPAPAHMLLFCGVALVAIAVIFAIERLHLLVKLMAWLALLGQTSAFVFIFEFYVFYIFVPIWVPQHLFLSPIVFVGSMLVIVAAAQVWANRRRIGWRLWLGVVDGAWLPAKRR